MVPYHSAKIPSGKTLVIEFQAKKFSANQISGFFNHYIFRRDGCLSSIFACSSKLINWFVGQSVRPSVSQCVFVGQSVRQCVCQSHLAYKPVYISLLEQALNFVSFFCTIICTLLLNQVELSFQLFLHFTPCYQKMFVSHCNFRQVLIIILNKI